MARDRGWAVSYAEGTSVPAERSRAEIERLLERYGAEQFAYGWQPGGAVVMFRHAGRSIRFTLPIPDPKAFALSPAGRRRTKASMEEAHAQEIRRRWRALALAIKAKLEVCASGIASFEDEFLAYTVLPDGKTVGQWAAPQIEAATATGKMPLLLLGGGS